MASKLLFWRVQSDEDGGFDELVVKSRRQKGGVLIHAEMMNSKAIYVDVAGVRIWAHVDRQGHARATMIENESGCRVSGPHKSNEPEPK